MRPSCSCRTTRCVENGRENLVPLLLLAVIIFKLQLNAASAILNSLRSRNVFRDEVAEEEAQTAKDEE